MNASQNHAAARRPADRPAPTSSAKASASRERDEDRPRDLVPRDPREALGEHHRHEGELRVDPRLGDPDDRASVDRPRRPRLVDVVTSPIGWFGQTNPSTATTTCTIANAIHSTARLDTRRF